MDTPKTVSEMFPNKYLTCEDLNGRTYVLKVKMITFEVLRDSFSKQDVQKGVLWFEGAHKGLVFNVTQARAMAEICGSEEFSQWIGHQVALRPGKAHNGKPTILIARAGGDELQT